MLLRDGSSIVFDYDRCAQCGACLAACHNGALIAKRNGNGLNEIVWDKESCTMCTRCVEVCPAGRLTGASLPALGTAQEICLAHARDERVRNAASSGGAGRMLFQVAIESGMVQEGYALKVCHGYPWAQGAVWTTGADYAQMPNSMYHPVPALREFPAGCGKRGLVVIGCPCQLDAVSRLVGPKVDVLKIALYCKQQKHLGLARFMGRNLGVGFDAGQKKAPVRWRGEGWPGTVSLKSRTVPYEVAAAVPFGWQLWRVPGCKACANPYGNNVDITLSDPWGIESNGPGETLVVVWSKRGGELLERAKGALSVKPITVEKAQSAFNKVDELSTSALARYHAGDWQIPTFLRLIGNVEKMQCKALEWVLDRFALPKIMMKIIAHLPNLRSLARWYVK